MQNLATKTLFFFVVINLCLWPPCVQAQKGTPRAPSPTKNPQQVSCTHPKTNSETKEKEEDPIAHKGDSKSDKPRKEDLEIIKHLELLIWLEFLKDYEIFDQAPQ